MSWYNNAWKKRLPITVDNTANATSALSYHQVSISLTGAAYTAFHASAKSDGSDIRVTDSDGVTLLSHALEGIDTTNSAVYLLVKVPAVAAGATRTIYVYYGNAAATSVSSYATTVGPDSAHSPGRPTFSRSRTTPTSTRTTVASFCKIPDRRKRQPQRRSHPVPSRER